MKTEKTAKTSFFKIVLRVIPMQFRDLPLLVTTQGLLGVVHALIYVAAIMATQNLFDTISLASAGQVGFRGCIMPLLLLAAATFGQQIMNGVHNFFHSVVAGITVNHIRTRLQRKLQRVDPARFEETAFLDDLNKAREGVNAIPWFCGISQTLLTFYLVYFAAVGAYLFRLKPILAVTLVISFIPALLAQVVRGRVFTRLEEESAPLRREYEYYQKTLCDREYFKETRILGGFRYFHRLFSDTMTLLTQKVWRAERKTALLQLLLSVTTFLGIAVSAYLLFTAAMAGEISLGAFAAVFASLGQVFYVMEEIVTQHLGYLNQNIGKIASFVKILDMPEREGGHGVSDFGGGIVAEGVSFTYPGREEAAVKNVSLSIADGETIAVVGENGAGKSTLVRLLTGLYRPSAGRVLVGGLDTAKTAPGSIFKGISGVFQKYQRYKMTLEENVTISDTVPKRDTVSIDAALAEADFDASAMEPDTMLSPEFDGIDLSGGQWQRLAIARGLYRHNGFIVLDEPTAAIDPIEETRIYTQFQHLAQDKCAAVVTHRLGSAKLAHRIVVMDAGEIVDIGTHEELLSRPGKYADMWQAQAQWYERDAVATP